MTDEHMPKDMKSRQHAMRVLAEADAAALEEAYARFENLPDWTFARKPEPGLVMVRGRTGGGGAPFNLGEISVTRSAVTLQTGETGHAYVAGRNQRKAAIAAVFDAAWQNDDLKQRVESEVIAPLAAKRAARDTIASRQAAATKVDFFTMVRGED